jgi:hypothetical protein
MNSWKTLLLVVVTAIALTIACPVMLMAADPTTSTTSTLLTSSVAESLTLTAPAGPIVVPTTPSVYSSPITYNAVWNIAPTSSYTLEIDIGFNTTTAAMTDGTIDVPSSGILMGWSGMSFFTQQTPNGPCTNNVSSHAVGVITGASCETESALTVSTPGSATGNLVLNSDATVAGTYSGTLLGSFEAY